MTEQEKTNNIRYLAKPLLIIKNNNIEVFQIGVIKKKDYKDAIIEYYVNGVKETNDFGIIRTLQQHLKFDYSPNIVNKPILDIMD